MIGLELLALELGGALHRSLHLRAHVGDRDDDEAGRAFVKLLAELLEVVPAHAGPRGLIFAGCLPSEWHCEDETPVIDRVLKGLGASRPHEIAFVDWTFSGVVADLPRLAAYLADRLGWPTSDERRLPLLTHLQMHAKPDARGLRLDIPRKSAVLVWRVA